MTYPPVPQHDAYPPVTARNAPTKDEDASQKVAFSIRKSGTSEADSAAPPLQIDFSVQRLWMSIGGKESNSFNDKGEPGDGDGGVDDLHFAPSVEDEKLKIHYTLYKPYNIKSAKLEIFCRGSEKRIFRKLWGGAFGPRGAKISELIPDGTTEDEYTGELLWSDVIEISKEMVVPEASDAELPQPVMGSHRSAAAGDPTFPGGFLTLDRSPYQVRLTVSSVPIKVPDMELQDRYGLATTSWSYLHVLAQSIEVKAGPKEWIPPRGADVEESNRERVTGYEEEILDKLGRATLAKDQEIPILLESNLFMKDNAEQIDDSDFTHYKNLWGDGPQVPLEPVVTIRTSDDKAAEGVDPTVLAGTRLLWDWQDDDPERWRKPFDANGDDTKRSEDFFEVLIQKYNQNHKPANSCNCPVELGGRHGDFSKPVFPKQSGKNLRTVDDAPRGLPFAVAGASKRPWASIARFDAAGRGGVLFQPSRLAGDRYQVRACLFYDEALDSEEPLPESDVLCEAGLFQVFRHIDVHCLVLGNGALPGIDLAQLQRNATKQYKDELYIDVTFNQTNIDGPSHQRMVQEACILQRKEASTYGKYFSSPLQLDRWVKRETPPDARMLSYYTHAEYRDRLKALFQSSPVIRCKLDKPMNDAKKDCYGELLVGTADPTAQGYPVMVREVDGTAPFFVLLAEGSAPFTDGMSVHGEATDKDYTLTMSPDAPCCWEHAIEDKNSADHTSKIKVVFAGRVEHTITFPRLRIKRTTAVHKIDGAIAALLDKFREAAAGFDPTQKFVIEIHAKDSDAAAVKRRAGIRAVLERCFDYFAKEFDAGRAGTDGGSPDRDLVIIDKAKVFDWYAREDQLFGEDGYRSSAQKSHGLSMVNPFIDHYLSSQDPVLPGVYYLMISAPSTYVDDPIAERHYRNRMARGESGAYGDAPFGAYDAKWQQTNRSIGSAYQAMPNPGGAKTDPKPFKDAGPVFAHEVGHALCLPHSKPQTLSQDALATHVADDAHCVMNYEPSPAADHFCAMCMLRTRGWNWKEIKNNVGAPDYKVELSVGDMSTLFVDPETTDAGKRARLHAMGLYNYPLSLADPDGSIFDRSWEYAKEVLPGVDGDPKALNTALESYLVEDGKIPEDGEFARVRFPGRLPTLWSVGDLAMMYPDHQAGDPPTPEEPYALSADPSYVEFESYKSNFAWGGVPIRIQVLGRPDQRDWSEADGAAHVRVCVELIAPDALPAHQRTDGFAGVDVAGGKSFVEGAGPPDLTAKPKAYLDAHLGKLDVSPGDPQRENAHFFIGGKRMMFDDNTSVSQSAGAYRNVITGSVATGFAELPQPKFKGKPRDHAVELETDEDGCVEFVFWPSLIGGDRYKFKVTAIDDAGNEQGEVKTGTFVRYRTVRVAGLYQMPCPTSEAELPDYLKEFIDKEGYANIDGRNRLEETVTEPWLEVDLKGHVTHELQKSFLEVILAKDAATPKAIEAKDWEAFQAQVRTEVIEHGDVINRPSLALKGKACTTSVTRIAMEGDGRVFRATVGCVTPHTVTIRAGTAIAGSFLEDWAPEDDRPSRNELAGKSLTAIAPGGSINGRSDRKRSSSPALPNVTGRVVDYDTGEIEVTFDESVGDQEIYVSFLPDDYIDIDALLCFPEKSPYLFNYFLPEDYNARKKSQYLPMREGGARPDQLGVIEHSGVGWTLAVFLRSLVRVLSNNGQSTCPGLVLVQAKYLDTYSHFFNPSSQEGKAIGNGVLLLNPIPMERNQEGINQLALHELCHALYLEHAPGGGANGVKYQNFKGDSDTLKDDTGKTLGTKKMPLLHDSEDVCVMSYSPSRDGCLCGQCVANLRGMRVHYQPFTARATTYIPEAGNADFPVIPNVPLVVEEVVEDPTVADAAPTSSDEEYEPDARKVAMVFMPQEMSNWCWAAASLMIRRHYLDDQTTQAALATEALFDPGTIDCALAENATTCNRMHALHLQGLNVTASGNNTPMEWDTIVAEIKADRPFIVAQAQHYLVCYGYEVTTTERKLELYDPLPVGAGAERTFTYAEYVSFVRGGGANYYGFAPKTVPTGA